MVQQRKLPQLPVVDEDPDEWGPDHLELEALGFPPEELEAIIAEGNRQGQEIDPDDDEDNGL